MPDIIRQGSEFQQAGIFVVLEREQRLAAFQNVPGDGLGFAAGGGVGDQHRIGQAGDELVAGLRLGFSGVLHVVAERRMGGTSLSMDAKGVAARLTVNFGIVEHRDRCVHFDWHWPHAGVPAGTGPLPIDRPLHQPAADRIGMEVVDHWMEHALSVRR
jgi:hypothetical protein